MKNYLEFKVSKVLKNVDLLMLASEVSLENFEKIEF